MTTTFAKLLALPLCLLAACGGSGAANSVLTPPTVQAVPAPAVPNPPVALLHAAGTKWARVDGSQVNLKGVNLGNWLINEFWMMGQGSAGIGDECKLEAALDARFGYAERERL